MIKNNALSPLTRPFNLNHFLSFVFFFTPTLCFIFLSILNLHSSLSLSLSLSIFASFWYTLFGAPDQGLALDDAAAAADELTEPEQRKTWALDLCCLVPILDFIALNLSVGREKKNMKNG